MPVATEYTLTIHAPVAYTPDDPEACIAAIAAEITAKCSFWSVALNETTADGGRQVLLKSSNADMSDYRGILFGGVDSDTNTQPANSTVFGSIPENDGYVYTASAVNKNTDTFDQDYDVGDPVTASGDYIPAVLLINDPDRVTLDTLRLIESETQLHILLYDASADVVYYAMFGVVARDFGGDAVYGHIGSYSTVSSNQLENETGNKMLPHHGQVYTNCVVWDEIAGAVDSVGSVINTWENNAIQNMNDGVNNNSFVMDIPLYLESSKRLIGYCHQRRVGSDKVTFDTMTTAGGQEYIAISYSTTSPGNAVWLKQPSP